MLDESQVSRTFGVSRLIIWVTIAAGTNGMLAMASATAAARLPNGALQSVVGFGGVVSSFAIGLVLLDRGVRTRTNPITPLYIAGVSAYLLLAFVVLYRLLFFQMVSSGKLDL